MSGNKARIDSFQSRFGLFFVRFCIPVFRTRPLVRWRSFAYAALKPLRGGCQPDRSHFFLINLEHSHETRRYFEQQ